MKSRFTTFVVTISLLLLFTGSGVCQNKVSAADLVDKVGQGNINWSAGYIEAVGIGAPPDNLIRKINARPIALREAKANALHNLLEIIKSVQVDSAISIKDFTAGSDIVDTQVKALVKGAIITDYQYMSVGTAEVRLTMPLYGNLAKIIIPLTMSMALPIPSASKVPEHVVCTGLVIDARGIQARPALLPRIFDEDGNEIYGSANVDVEYAMKEGMSGYSRDLMAAQSNQRVGTNPITVKALRSSGAGKSDMIISNADAQKVRSSAVRASFLKQCNVMIVLD